MTRFSRLSSILHAASHQCTQNSLVQTFQATTSASVDELWQTITNLADVTWHPILASTNVPQGLVVKPGLIYQAVTRVIPIPIQIFVERVKPQTMLSVRILVMPGLEERVTYQVQSSVCGASVSYSVTLRGWLSPLAGSFLRPCAAKVAINLVRAVEQAALLTMPGERKPAKHKCWDL